MARAEPKFLDNAASYLRTDLPQFCSGSDQRAPRATVEFLPLSSCHIVDRYPKYCRLLMTQRVTIMYGPLGFKAKLIKRG
jgi:hypothetical protein